MIGQNNGGNEAQITMSGTKTGHEWDYLLDMQ